MSLKTQNKFDRRSWNEEFELPRYNNKFTFVKTTQSVNLYSEPNLDSRIKAVLNMDSTVKALGVVGDWTKVELTDTHQMIGYIDSRFLY